MDDILKRLVGAYLGFTLALWAISFAMAGNGSAFSKNYAWVIVSSLRFYFTVPLVMGAAIAVGTFLFWSVAEARAQSQKFHLDRVRAEKEQLHLEERKRQAEREAELRTERESARLVREKEAQAAARERWAEAERQKAIEKKMRSGSAAAERALDDF